MPEFKSIFSNNNPDISIKLWLKATAPQKASIKLEKGLNLLKASKKSSNAKELVYRFFKVEDSNLLCFSDIGASLKGILDLSYCHVQVQPMQLNCVTALMNQPQLWSTVVA